MNQVWIVEKCENAAERYAVWDSLFDRGLFRGRQGAENAMFNMMEREMEAVCARIAKMTSTKRGKGKLAYHEAVREMSMIPRRFRVREIQTQPARRSSW